MLSSIHSAIHFPDASAGLDCDLSSDSGIVCSLLDAFGSRKQPEPTMALGALRQTLVRTMAQSTRCDMTRIRVGCTVDQPSTAAAEGLGPLLSTRRLAVPRQPTVLKQLDEPACQTSGSTPSPEAHQKRSASHAGPLLHLTLAAIGMLGATASVLPQAPDRPGAWGSKLRARMAVATLSNDPLSNVACVAHCDASEHATEAVHAGRTTGNCVHRCVHGVGLKPTRADLHVHGIGVCLPGSKCADTSDSSRRIDVACPSQASFETDRGMEVSGKQMTVAASLQEAAAPVWDLASVPVAVSPCSQLSTNDDGQRVQSEHKDMLRPPTAAPFVNDCSSRSGQISAEQALPGGCQPREHGSACVCARCYWEAVGRLADSTTCTRHGVGRRQSLPSNAAQLSSDVQGLQRVAGCHVRGRVLTGRADQRVSIAESAWVRVLAARHRCSQDLAGALAYRSSRDAAKRYRSGNGHVLDGKWALVAAVQKQRRGDTGS
jgi:hypothetical protein